MGLLIAVVVHAANIQDREGAKLLLAKLKGQFSRLKLIWADGGYSGKLIEWTLELGGWVLEIVKRSDDVSGFKVLPHRWVVERTFGWLGRYRRLSKDYEELTQSSEAMIRIAMIIPRAGDISAFALGGRYRMEKVLLRQDALQSCESAMLQMQFTEEEKKALRYERFHHLHPRVQQKMDALLLKSHNLPHATIASILDIDEGTLRTYLQDYQQGGIERLKTINWHGSQSELSQHQGTVKDFFCKIRQRLSRTPRRRLPS